MLVWMGPNCVQNVNSIIYFIDFIIIILRFRKFPLSSFGLESYVYVPSLHIQYELFFVDVVVAHIVVFYFVVFFPSDRTISRLVRPQWLLLVSSMALCDWGRTGTATLCGEHGKIITDRRRTNAKNNTGVNTNNVVVVLVLVSLCCSPNDAMFAFSALNFSCWRFDGAGFAILLHLLPYICQYCKWKQISFWEFNKAIRDSGFQLKQQYHHQQRE